MTAVKKRVPVTVDEYLASELRSTIKHEYLGGKVYAMAGTNNIHSEIAINITSSLRVRMRGQHCKTYSSDTKIRIQLPTRICFYYPDASVTCRPNPGTDSYQDHPLVIVEVLSRSTRRFDEGEKQQAYLTIPSLCVYLLVEQDAPLVVAFRRADTGFVREVYEGLAAVIPLPEIDTALPLAEIYEAVDLVPEPEDEENV